jgi:hypothetical protein
VDSHLGPMMEIKAWLLDGGNINLCQSGEETCWQSRSLVVMGKV